jgi:hypothetical protein
MEKQLENLEKKKRQSSPAGPARPSQAARPRRLTVGATCQRRFLPHALPPPSLCPVGPTCRRQLLPPPLAPLFPLRLVGPFCQTPSSCPVRPFSLSLCAVGLPCQFRPPRAHRGPTSAHSRTSPGSSATSLYPRPSSF